MCSRIYDISTVRNLLRHNHLAYVLGILWYKMWLVSNSNNSMTVRILLRLATTQKSCMEWQIKGQTFLLHSYNRLTCNKDKKVFHTYHNCIKAVYGYLLVCYKYVCFLRLHIHRLSPSDMTHIFLGWSNKKTNEKLTFISVNKMWRTESAYPVPSHIRVLNNQSYMLCLRVAI